MRPGISPNERHQAIAHGPTVFKERPAPAIARGAFLNGRENGTNDPGSSWIDPPERSDDRHDAITLPTRPFMSHGTSCHERPISITDRCGWRIGPRRWSAESGNAIHDRWTWSRDRWTWNNDRGTSINDR
jgi:hypothetical protein